MDAASMKKINEQLACFGRNNILWTAMDKGLDLDRMDGCAPQQLCAHANKYDWGIYDRLSPDKQQKWDRRATARNEKSPRLLGQLFQSDFPSSGQISGCVIHRSGEDLSE
ncbi:hypothetical protein MVEN_01065000 [Mycena venus]|uniref:Uncharacterized protein n=1 Tax=Mycena venus TaxID=2733690 RepID=A0A8H6Y912_9AGAR|nr:hypothetical protein MVEN_01065000 [Mycena venus]